MSRRATYGEKGIIWGEGHSVEKGVIQREGHHIGRMSSCRVLSDGYCVRGKKRCAGRNALDKL